ncbi:SAM and SH3 domain-containing protein 1-like isoform X1 [Mizuhopecten yessoensis]|uniref:SAM and SH3 domain-containing protein 1-like isoform X1 n=1 Tax=Mizuhopecten yessoensis TaxID=6573 RepID=UPI000B45DCF4|nr:SAM and SH3 domain-containing protein 1-like isoform X1 [Mizuhopecten yessoensis]
MSDNIIVDWLKSVRLELYTQAFLDNGYDELEVCKQIGEADLDAIGVHNGVHREILLQAVTRLREEGGTSVYFTLENTDVQQKVVKNGSEQSKSVKLGTRSASSRRGLPKTAEDVPYKTLEQLRKYVGDKLVKDGIDLACPPYVKPDNSACHSSLAALAVKYTDQLKGSSLQDVYRCLEELSMWRIKGPHHYYSTAMPPVQPAAVVNSHLPYASQVPPHTTSLSGHSPYARTGHAQFAGSCQAGHSPYASSVQTGRSNYASSGQVSHSPYASAGQTCHSPYASSSQAPVHAASYPVYASSGQASSCTMSQAVYGSPGTQPPPIPSSLPPATSHVEKNIDLHSVHTRYIYENTGFQTERRYEDLDGKDDDKKKSSTLGRFFRNIGLRRSGKKHSYKPHKGDPNAFDITMDDDDRMALMLMVKEGKITTEHALQVVSGHWPDGTIVKKYEEERRKDLEQREKAFKRKKKQTRPVKSPSATYTGSMPRCDVCSGFKGSPHDLGYPTGNVCVDPTHQMEYSQHRRVHSVGHIDHAYSSRSPEGTRSLNCTPTHCAMSRSSAVSTPVSFYSPGHHPKLYSPVFPQDPRLSLYQCRACSHHNSSMSSGGVTGRCHTALGVRVSQSESSPGVNITREDLSPGGEASRSGSCVDHSPSTTSFDLVSSESEHSIDCQSHGHVPYNHTPSHKESGHYLSNTGAISTNPGDRNRSPQVQGVWQKNVTHRDANSRNHGKENLVIGASPKSASSESNHSNHSADSSGLCSYRSASPNGGQTVVPVDEVSGCGQVSYVQAHSDFVPTSNSRDALTLQKGDVIRVLYKPPGDLWRGVLKGKTGWFRASCIEPLYTGETALEPWLDRRPNKPKTVQEVLQVIGLESLEAVFIQNGFDELDCFADVDEEDLDLLGIFDPLIRTKLLSTADLIKNTQDTPTLHWKFHQGRAGPPVAFMNKEYRHGTSYPPSQDSGCYASFEHLAQRDAYPTTSELKQQYCLHSNKENISPGARAGAPGLAITRPQRGHSGVGSSENSEDLDRSDKEYTAEDREVSEITNSVDCNTTLTSKAATNDLSGLSGDAVIMCNFAGTQTSPTYGRANCDNSANNLSSPKAHMRQSGSTNGDFVSSSQSQEGSVCSPLHSAPPFPRKCVPRQDWNFRDVQVQVMCPLGSLNLNAEGVQDGEGVPLHPHMTHNTPPTSLVLSNPQGANLRQTDSGGYRSVSRPDDGGYRSVGQLSRRSMSADRASVKRTKPEDPPEYRTVMRSLLNLITSKLVSENINLALEPYSTKAGECGIPPLLVQRYADELRQDLVSVALVVDQVRVQQLCSRHRPAVLSRDLPDSAAKACEIKISSIPEFFTSIGLPMYTSMFLEEKMSAMEDLLQLNFEDIRDITRTHAKHVKRISHALEWVRTRISTLRKTSNKDAAVMDRV